MALPLLGQGFCRNRVCPDAATCEHSWTISDQCVDSTADCATLCNGCRAYAVARFPPATHPGECRQRNKARCVIYDGEAWAIMTSQHDAYQCYARTPPPLPPLAPPSPSPPPSLPPSIPPPPPRTIDFDGVGPWPAPLSEAIGTTSSSGSEPDGVGGTLWHARGTPIFGPFLPAISDHDGHGGLLRHLGCAPGTGRVPAGVDTRTAEQVLALQCNVTLPRIDASGHRIGLLTACGGQGFEFRFHERLTCIENGHDATLNHSQQVGQALDGRAIYGEYEASGDTVLARPALDACGGHFGPVPGDSAGVSYHYHVSRDPPFTLGCFGPAGAVSDGSAAVPGTSARLVNVSECRALYPLQCDDSPPTTLFTASGTGEQLYDLYCPCFDELGSNVGVYRGSAGGSSSGGGSGGRTRRPSPGSGRNTSVNLVLGFLGAASLCCQVWFCLCLRRHQRKRLTDCTQEAAGRLGSTARIAPKKPLPSSGAEGAERGELAPDSVRTAGGGASAGNEMPEPTRIELQRLSVKELRSLAMNRSIDISDCVEKRDIVDELLRL